MSKASITTHAPEVIPKETWVSLKDWLGKKKYFLEQLRQRDEKIAELEQENQRLRDALQEIMWSGIELDDSRMSYKVVQISHDAWDDGLKALKSSNNRNDNRPV